MADPVVTSHHAIAPSAPDGAEVTITVDGRALTAMAGEFLIAAAERHGVFIPRFCYHPRLKPVGMCRMCLVEVSGPRGATLQPACYIPVADQMVVDTTSAKTRKAQDGVLEFLLVNHPLDCPVCDKGGECPLQDQTLAYGPGESRFLEEKRHFAKPIALSELVLLDRERCIQCGRCTRFAAEYAGEAQIDFFGRGDEVEVAVADGHVFSSVFSGNTVQICPVGALTATPYRFTARPWDLDQVESTCTTCAVGCRVAVQSSSNRLTRMLGIDVDAVNQSWLCDKGRYGYEAVNAEQRLTTPWRRAAAGTDPGEVTWAEALADVAARIRSALATSGPGAVAFIGGARLSNEDAYAWAKLAKGLIGTDNVDAQLGDGLPADMVLGLPRATIDDLDRARAVVLLCADLRDELPVLFLRLRSAAVDGGVPVVEVSAAPTSMSPHAAVCLRPKPGEAAGLVDQLAAGPASGRDGGDLHAARQVLAAAGAEGEGVVVVVGRPSLSESAQCTVDAVSALRRAWPSARFLPALRRGNVMGAIDMGLAPGLLPGRVTLGAGGDWFRAAGWPAVPAAPGRDTAGILTAAADGAIEVLVLVGADPVGDFVDHRLALAALERVPFTVAVDSFASTSTAHADVVLPVAMHHERTGTTTNIEGRVSRVGQKLVAPGQCWPDWMVAAEIAGRLGADLGVGSVSELWDEIERLAPSHAGITRAVLDGPAARDGVVAPIAAVGVAIRTGSASGPRDQRIDPVATPGIESVERQGAPPRAGQAEPVGFEDVAVVASGSTATRPVPVVWAAPAREAQPVVGAPGTLRLVVRRRLYDHGVLVQAAPALAALAPDPVVHANPSDLAHAGIADGAVVVVTSARGRAQMGMRADAGIPAGTAVVYLGTPDRSGDVATNLIGAADRVVDVTLAVATP